MLGIMYFLLIRPQQKEARRHQEMLNALKKGDEVVTFGGLYGKIMGFSGDRVSLRVAENVKVEVDKAKILRLVERTAGASDRPEPAEKAEPAERSGKGAARAT
jgi:preprotein translocase subunit YajC